MNTRTLVEVVIDLKDGPSRDRLFDAFKYAQDDDARISVDFFTKDGERIAIVPQMLEHEDGSGQSFNGHGFITMNEIAGHKVADKHIFFYFNTRGRHGYIKIKEQQN